MAQDYPSYKKLIFITYDIQKDNAIWLYQRLKYADLPVRTYNVDEAIGGAGFGYNSIAVADPMIAVLSNSTRYSTVPTDIQTAKNKGKQIYLALFEEVDLPDDSDSRIFDFRLSREQTFQELREHLLGRNYPEKHRSSSLSIEEARDRIAFHNDSGSSEFFTDYYYLRVFNEASYLNIESRVAAIRDLGELGILSGLLLAALADDPADDVRCTAALALAKFKGSKFILSLRRASKEDVSPKVRLYADTALKYIESPSYIEDLARDLTEVFNIGRHAFEPPNQPIIVSQISSFSVFISYTRKDCEEIALQLKDRLESEGVQVWIDTKLQAGVPRWTKEITDAILSSSIMLVVLSPAVHDSEWVEKEVLFAQENKKEIIPVLGLKTGKPLYLASVNGLRGEPVFNEKPGEVIKLIMERIQNQEKHLGST